MCDYPAQLNPNAETPYAKGRRGGGGGRRHGGGGRRHWHGGKGRGYYRPRRRSYVYSYSYPYSYSYLYPYNYGYYYPYYTYSYPYYSYPYYRSPVVDVETVNVGKTQQQSTYGSCSCDGNKASSDYCARGYEASCQGGSCTCISTDEVRAAMGDWGCGSSKGVYCPTKQ